VEEYAMALLTAEVFCTNFYSSIFLAPSVIEISFPSTLQSTVAFVLTVHSAHILYSHVPQDSHHEE
jgi:hypothetical protein